MTNDEAYAKLINRKCSSLGAVRALNYAYQAQFVGSWRALIVSDRFAFGFGGSEAAKELTMDMFRDAGIDPMTITFPEPLEGPSPFSTN
ncbi:MAG: hypothetical protein ACRYFS_16100 [Janthinobacterium lividum]